MVSSKLAVKGFNFIVRNGKGELVRSILWSKAPRKINFSALRYIPKTSKIIEKEKSEAFYLDLIEKEKSLAQRKLTPFQRFFVNPMRKILGLKPLTGLNPKEYEELQIRLRGAKSLKPAQKPEPMKMTEDARTAYEEKQSALNGRLNISVQDGPNPTLKKMADFYKREEGQIQLAKAKSKSTGKIEVKVNDEKSPTLQKMALFYKQENSLIKLKRKIELIKGNKSAKERVTELSAEYDKCEAEFVEKHRNDILPPYKERYKEVLGDMRLNYGQSAGSVLWHAECVAKKEEKYLEHIFEKTPQAKRIKRDKALLRMHIDDLEMQEILERHKDTPELLKGFRPSDLDVFNGAACALREKNIPYDEVELAEIVRGIKPLKNGLFSESGLVAGHACAYEINPILRQGFEADCTLRRILDEGFRTVKPLEKAEVAYREVVGNRNTGSINFINQLIKGKKGDTITDKGYSFASYYKGAAQSCNEAQDLDVPHVMIKILVPEKARVSDGRIYEQYEMLFPRNAKFRIVQEAKQTYPDREIVGADGKKFTAAGEYEIVLEYILPE